ncbi:DUF4177 domain-containing protein [Rhodobacteraceae bacterium F11138]|nr:DUF4177 domain-containing protein [Rhodobacteraceae bacterium F11138]
MPRYEYKVVPAPAKGQKSKTVKTPEGRFALSIEEVLNEMAASGWEYQRAELLPSEERTGLTGSTTNWRNMLIFRRALDEDAAAFPPQVIDSPGHIAPMTAPAPIAAQQPAQQLSDRPDDGQDQDPPLTAPEPEADDPPQSADAPIQFPDRRS